MTPTATTTELRAAAQHIRAGAPIPADTIAAWLDIVAIDQETEPESGPRLKELSVASSVARAVLAAADPDQEGDRNPPDQTNEVAE